MNQCIEVREISKSYGSQTVVDRLSFMVAKGEVFGLLGHNGAGKTSTIEMILGLCKVDSGKVTILGREPRTNRREIGSRIGVQLQTSSYPNNIRVNEVCEEMAALYDNPADYHELLKQFHLEQYSRQPVAKLSGGERHKLSLVVALIPQPEILFLDELTTGLDVAARREVWQQLAKLKKTGMTIVLTTHYMEEAEALCDRICLIKQGKAVTVGNVAKIIGQSPYDKLEEAYLWYMGEEALYD